MKTKFFIYLCLIASVMMACSKSTTKQKQNQTQQTTQTANGKFNITEAQREFLIKGYDFQTEEIDYETFLDEDPFTLQDALIAQNEIANAQDPKLIESMINIYNSVIVLYTLIRQSRGSGHLRNCRYYQFSIYRGRIYHRQRFAQCHH